MQKDLNKKVTQATKWSSVTEFTTKLIAPITNAILARLLVPEAFGVVATLMMVISFAEVFTDAGFQKYLVQREFKDEDDLNLSTNVAFWTNIAFSIAVWGIIAIFATPIAKLVGSEGHELAIIVISAEIPLLAFSSIQMARYRRDFNFKGLFVVRVVIAMVPLVVTVPLALIFRNYWALVVGTLTKDILNAVVLTARSRWKPSFRYSFDKLKQMFSFSIWTIVENVAIWFCVNVGTFIVSFYFGAYQLGLYKTTVSTITNYFAVLQNAVLPVLFATLSRCQNDDREFQSVFFKFQRMMAMLVLPLGFGVFAYRKLATLILFGDQWLDTVDFVGMTALSHSFLFIFSFFNSEAFRGKGRPKLSILAQVAYLFVMAPTMWLCANHSYTAVTVGNAISHLALAAATSAVAHFILKIRFGKVLKNVYPSLVSAAIMGLAGMGLRTLWDNTLWDVVSIILCVLIYAGCMLLLPAGRRQLAEVPILRKVFRLKEGVKQGADPQC